MKTVKFSVLFAGLAAAHSSVRGLIIDGNLLCRPLEEPVCIRTLTVLIDIHPAMLDWTERLA